MSLKTLLAFALVLTAGTAHADFGCANEGNGTNTITTLKESGETAVAITGRLRPNANSEFIKEEAARVEYGLVLDAAQPFEIRNEFAYDGKTEVYNCAYKSVTLRFKNHGAYKKALERMNSGRDITLTGTIGNGGDSSILETENAYMNVIFMQ